MHFVASLTREHAAAGRWRLIALTNNFGGYRSTSVPPSREMPKAELRFLGWEDGPIPSHLRELFDHFYDSSEIGLRCALPVRCQICK